MTKNRGWILLAAGLILAGASRASSEVAAVLSSESPYYTEALQGFKEVFTRPAQVVTAGRNAPISGDVRVFVAFGKKAALEEYPKDSTLVYCMAPGTVLSSSETGLRTVRVPMVPPPAEAVAAYRRIQPSLKRLAVLWKDGYREYAAQLGRAADAAGLEIISVRVKGSKDLPDHLRAPQDRADALWILPDPLLVNEDTIALLKDFSWANDIPFHAPTASLADKGAAGAVCPDFREVGRSAALAALQTLSGDAVPDVFYPRRTRIILNPAAAANAGLSFPPEILRQADQVLP